MDGRADDPEEFSHWRALDAPFLTPGTWSKRLQRGTCTLCGEPAARGLRRWWHLGESCWPVKPGRTSCFRKEDHRV